MSRSSLARNIVLALFLVVVLPLGASAQITWTQVPTPSTSFTLHTVCFVDDTLGFLADRDGVVMRTTDAGGAWSTVGMVGTKNVYCMAFRDDRTGIVAGDGVAYWTDDGGSTWQKRGNLADYFVQNMYFLNASTVVAVHDRSPNGDILRTINSGYTWNNVEGAASILSSIAFQDSVRGVLCGGLTLTP